MALLALLVPIAAVNPTAVDAVLGRLALALPADEGMALADRLLDTSLRVQTVDPTSGFEVAGYA